MVIVKIPNFPEGQYIKSVTDKKRIILHHTVSSNEQSPINWWEQTPERVATSYVIAKDGTIIEVYDSDYWAYHIGKGSTATDNKEAIGIEIVNEGGLFRRDESYFWLDGKAKYSGIPHNHNAEWRGFRYFASYQEEQYQAVAELCKMLCEKHKIVDEVYTGLDYSKEYFKWNGILSHRNLRADKTDVSPAWDMDKFINLMRIK